MIKQDVYSNALYITLTNNGTLVSFDDTTHVSVVVDKPDLTQVIGSAEIVKTGLVKYVVDYQAIAAVGITTITLKIHDNEGVTTTSSFNLKVIEDPYAGTDGSVESTSDYPVLTELISRHTQYVAAENSRVAAELLRVDAETIRSSNESNRLSNEDIRTSNEISRIQEEDLRASAELLRVNAESIRGVNEQARIDAEAIRNNSESTRQSQESTRELQEDARKAAESLRVTAEGLRESAETSRNNAESDRVSAEITRSTAETSRVNAEEARVSAEGLRVNAESARVLAEQDRDTAYQGAESARDALYSTAEDNRNTLHSTAEGARDTLYNAAEAARDGLYSTAEDARDGLYNTAELNRDSQYSTAESARDALYNSAESARDTLYTTAEAARDVKMGTLANLTTTEKGSIVGAVNEIDADLTAHKEDYMRSQQLPHFNHAAQGYINLDQFWNNLRNGKIYTSEFNQPSVSMASSGIKLDDNANLVMGPSTNTVAGRDDYSKIGLFMPIEVNAYVDKNDDYHVVAIEGDGRFQRDGSMGDVYIMNMVGYQKYVSTDTKWRISYSDIMHAGFEVIDEAVKPDGTIRPYLLHAKYVAGRNPYENNNLASISGVYPEFVNMSHNGQITEFGKKGTQYSGKTSHDDYWVQLMMWLKYATMNSDTIMKGCQSYYLQYVNLVAETGVNRVILTNAQANSLLVGSTVSIGDYNGSTKTDDRQQVRNYNKVNRVNITSIEDLGNGNSAVYVNSSPFDTTLTTTITTYPWNSGGCDNVLGVDGSPYSNSSGKEPFILNKIEMIVGGNEILQNLIILNNSVDNRTDVYANYDCKTYATSITSAYDLVGQLARTNNTWKYGSKMVKPSLHPSVILVTEAEASSTTGTGDGIYTNPSSTGGTRAWLSLGALSHGALCGLRYLNAYASLAAADWRVLGRLSATGRSRRRAGVN